MVLPPPKWSKTNKLRRPYQTEWKKERNTQWMVIMIIIIMVMIMVIRGLGLAWYHGVYQGIISTYLYVCDLRRWLIAVFTHRITRGWLDLGKVFCLSNWLKFFDLLNTGFPSPPLPGTIFREMGQFSDIQQLFSRICAMKFEWPASWTSRGSVGPGLSRWFFQGIFANFLVRDRVFRV